MNLHQQKITIATHGAGLYRITDVVKKTVRSAKLSSGLCHLFLQHTSASLLIQENADPDVLADLQSWIEKIAPVSDRYRHQAEGPDDMPGHLRTAITAVSELIPIEKGELALGTWQGIYLWEHRAASQTRTIFVSVFGTIR